MAALTRFWAVTYEPTSWVLGTVAQHLTDRRSVHPNRISAPVQLSRYAKLCKLNAKQAEYPGRRLRSLHSRALALGCVVERLQRCLPPIGPRPRTLPCTGRRREILNLRFARLWT